MARVWRGDDTESKIGMSFFSLFERNSYLNVIFSRVEILKFDFGCRGQSKLNLYE